MNARQRKGVLMVAGAVILGLCAFLLMAGYAGSVNAQVGDKITVFTFTRDIDALTEITDDDVESVQVPRKWVGEGTMTDRTFIGRKTYVPVAAGSYVDASMLVPVQDLKTGEREIAINVDAETGVGGRIRSGDYVNILVAFEEQQGDLTVRTADVLIERARVVSYGGEREEESDEGGLQTVVPVTFALSDQDSLRLLYAETFAKSIRLSKVPVGDPDQPAPNPVTNGGIIKKYGG